MILTKFVLVNHASGETMVDNSKTAIEKALRIWIERGTDVGDITLIQGRELDFFVKERTTETLESIEWLSISQN